ncbi:hypothetical protein FBU30_006239 [Linnemannia zychae]|nr:hypothetical protein FBU30_006239 [Linnemannia zychae]
MVANLEMDAKPTSTFIRSSSSQKSTFSNDPNVSHSTETFSPTITTLSTYSRTIPTIFSQNEQSSNKSSKSNTNLHYRDDKENNINQSIGLLLDITVISTQIIQALPDEIWCLLLSFIPPTTLITFTRVCRRWKLIIEQDLIALYWKPLAIQAKLLDPLDMGDARDAEMPIGLLESFSNLVLGHSLVICELCLMRSNRGCGSAIPLPVNRCDTLGRVWMCRPCRRDYYERYPESTRPFHLKDRESLYGLDGFPAMNARSTGSLRPRRHSRPFFLHQWGDGFRSRHYYDEYDSDFESSDDECYLIDDDEGELEYDSGENMEYQDWSTDELNDYESVDSSDSNAISASDQISGGSVNGQEHEELDAVFIKTDAKHYEENATIVSTNNNATVGDQPLTKKDIISEVEEYFQRSDSECSIISLDNAGESKVKTAQENPDTSQVGRTSEHTDAVTNGSIKLFSDVMEPEQQKDEEKMKGDQSKNEDTSSECIDTEKIETLETHIFGALGEQTIVQEARLHHGGDIGIQAHNGNIAAKLHDQLKALRYKMMETRLGVLGLHPRDDSKLCQDYIDGLMDDPFKIAIVMKQMQWYFSATSYASHIKNYDSATAKCCAMRLWVQMIAKKHKENAKNAYRKLPPGEDPENAKVDLMDATQPPKRYWPVLDIWIDKILGGEAYMPLTDIFAVQVGTDDLQD